MATVDGTRDVEVPTRQGRLVLALLALAAGPVTRDELAELVWPERLPQAWERDLSAVVSRLRRVLAGAQVPNGLTGSVLLVNLATWSTLAIELCLALLVWCRRLRPWVLGLGVALHVCI